MAFRRSPPDPFDDLSADLLASSLRAVGGLREDPLPGGETDFPALDIYETAQEIVIEAELPGIDPGRIEVAAGEGLVTIEGVKDEALEPGRVNFLCMERTFGAFRRVVPILQAVNLTRASAVCRSGVLQIRVPKLEEKRGRRRVIPVNAEPAEERNEP